MSDHDKSFLLILFFVVGAIYCYFTMDPNDPVVLDLPEPTPVVVPNAQDYECVKTKECTIRVYPTPEGTRLQLVVFEEPEYEQL